MLGYLANTLIFVLVGVVISQRAFSGVEATDWIFMAVLYFGIVVIRYVTDPPPYVISINLLED